MNLKRRRQHWVRRMLRTWLTSCALLGSVFGAVASDHPSTPSPATASDRWPEAVHTGPVNT